MFTGAQMQAIFASQCAAWGESLSFTRSGSVTASFKAVCDHPSNVYLQQNFFDDDELVALVQPLVAVYIDGTGGGTGYVPAIVDTFVRDGVTYAIQKVGVWRIGGLVIAYLAMGAITA